MMKALLSALYINMPNTVLLSGFQSSLELWKPLSKVVPGKFHGSGEQSERNCLQDRANYHRFKSWQIVLIFNTECT